jgi:alpha-L-fucosidase 2
MAGPWLAQHVWEHYAFGRDNDFLRRHAYPIMRGSAEFCLDYLVDNGEGLLVTAPSTSPENAFFAPDGSQGTVTIGSTMDFALIRNLFANCIAAAAILDTDSNFSGGLKETLARLPAYRIGRHGQLQEWLEDFDEPEPHHRHVSHLWGVFPGDEITPSDTPDLAAAAKRSLELRGDAGTGWSLGWKLGLWARLGDGNHAYRLVRALLTLVDTEETNYTGGGGVYANLFDAHPPFQIDGNFAFTAGVIEMLLQSHRKPGLFDIHVLPALPTVWATGNVRGLRARGGFTFDLRWERGVVQEIKVHSKFGLPFQVRSGEKVTAPLLAAGETLTLRHDLSIVR